MKLTIDKSYFYTGEGRYKVPSHWKKGDKFKIGSYSDIFIFDGVDTFTAMIYMYSGLGTSTYDSIKTKTIKYEDAVLNNLLVLPHRALGLFEQVKLSPYHNLDRYTQVTPQSMQQMLEKWAKDQATLRASIRRRGRNPSWSSTPRIYGTGGANWYDIETEGLKEEDE